MSTRYPKKSLLVVEDSESKWREVQRLLLQIGEEYVSVERAGTMEEANSKIAKGNWDLVLLDISMDIRASSTGPRAGGHDTVGGLKIAERMFYLSQEAPVIIVTAFDAFPSGKTMGNAVLGLDEVIREASELLGDHLVGWIRYGEKGWAHRLLTHVQGAFQR